MVNVTIDGKQIQVPEGTTVLRAAESAGIKIPTLCDHKELTPYGGCRLCLVEVEGARTLQPSCTLPVNQNMVVKTDTEKVKEARKFVLTLIFSERNHFCMFCQVSGGDCELQNSAYAEGMTHWPLQPNYSPFTVDASNPFFVLDNNRCILCRRCVRACGELVGNYTLGIEERGANSLLVADIGTPLGESTCISCGTCIQVCPTGALIDRQSAYYGRDKDVTHVKSVCTQCSLGCGIDVITRDNRVVRIDGDWDSEVNHGLLCSLGRFEPLVNDHERVATPLVRKESRLKAATFSDAVDSASALLKESAKDGSSVGALISSKVSVESLSTFNQLFKGMKNVQFGTLDGTDYTSANSSLDGKTKAAALDQIDQADCIIVVGADLIKDHQVAGFLVKRSLPLGSKLILVDTKSNQLASYADAVIEPGKDYSLIIDQLKEGLQASKHEQETDLGKAITFIKSAGKIMLIIGKLPANTSSEKVTGLVKALKSKDQTLDIITLKRHANSYASYLFGLDKPVNLKGLKTVFVFQGDEEIDQKLAKELELIPNLVIQSTFVSSLTTKAQVVLPAPSWSETEGTFLSADGRIQSIKKVINPSEDTRATVEVLQRFAASTGTKLVEGWKSGLDKTRVAVGLDLN
jgi:formate dehydrogenase major subunit